MTENVHTDSAPTAQNTTADTRVRWQGHLAAAIIDLRNSDRSSFEQIVYETLRSILETPTSGAPLTAMNEQQIMKVK